jgi:hypothetical protein
MSNTVAIRFRSYLPGSGFDSNGNPKQGKQEVRGKVAVTSYAAGESLPPSKVGLTTIDWVHLAPDNAVGGANGQGRVALYDHSSQEFYVFQSEATGLDDANIAGKTFTVSFNAFGDSAHDVELT